MSLVFADFHPRHLHEGPFLASLVLFLMVTGLTWTRGFERLQPSIMMLVPLLDVLVICLFDLVPETELVDSMVVLPAVWLGLMFGRRGVTVTVLSVALLAVAPGLLTHGAPEDGWAQAVSFVVLAGLSSTAMSLCASAWAGQMMVLERRSQELRSANKAKGDFVTLVSHELRTPLTSILGYLEMIHEMEEPIPEEALPYLAALTRNSDRLLLLVTDLLAASEAENRPMRLTVATTDMTALANQSLDDLSQRAREAGLTLVRDLPPNILITADASRLLQVLDNLVSNAIKFTPANGRITVRLLPRDNGIDLVVSDTGVGIDEDSVPLLGTKFFRAPQATQAAIPGVGLGLMICKTIVEAHHGTLSITSQVNKGTSACVHLPTGMSSAQQPPSARSLSPTRK